MPNFKITWQVEDTFDADDADDARFLFLNALHVGRYDDQVVPANVEEVE